MGETMLAILVALLCAIIAYWYIWRPQVYWKNLNLPYLTPIPIFGNFVGSILQRSSFSDDVLKIYRQMGDKKVCGIFMLDKPALMVKDINVIKCITIKDFDHFVDHSNMLFNKSADEFMGKTIFLLAGQKWRKMRATLSPAFTSKKMKDMFEIISECGDYMVTYFRKESALHNGGPIPVEMKNVFSKFTNDVISTTAFGIKCDSFMNEHNEFFTNGKKMTNFPTWRVFFANTFPWLAKSFRIGYISNNVYEFFRNTIKSTLNIRKVQNIIRPDILNLLMEAQKGSLEHDDDTEKEDYSLDKNIEKAILSDEDIAAQAMLFFLGGFDTVSGVLSFIAYELAVNEDIQKRLQNEFDMKFKSSGEQITYQQIQDIEYLDMVISETLRKWAPAPFLDRLCIKTCKIQCEDGTEITIQKGTNILIPVAGFHSDRTYFENPEKFDPERFNNENKRNINQSVYMPFGVGPRNCIGSRFALMEIKIALIYLLLTFDIEVTKDTQIPLRLTTKSPNVSSEKGIHVGLKLRQ